MSCQSWHGRRGRHKQFMQIGQVSHGTWLWISFKIILFEYSRNGGWTTAKHGSILTVVVIIIPERTFQRRVSVEHFSRTDGKHFGCNEGVLSFVVRGWTIVDPFGRSLWRRWTN